MPSKVDIGVCKGLTSKLQVVAPGDELSNLRQRSQQPTSGMGNCAEVSSQHGALIYASEPLREEIQRIQETQAQEIIELSKKHQVDLTAAQAKTDEVESRYQEAMRRLEGAVNAHSSMSHESDLALAAEREIGAAAKSMSEGLDLENSRLRTVQIDQRKWLADVQQRLDEQADLLEKKEDTIMEKDRQIVELQSEMQEFRTGQVSQLEEVERTSLDRLQQLEDELSEARDDLSQSRSLHHSVLASHEEELVSKDEEIKGLVQVVEGYQSQMQSIHEQKEREVHEAKLDLIEEHEKVVSDLHRQHSADVADVEFSNGRNLQALQAKHEKALESARGNHASKVTTLDKSLQDSVVKNEMIKQEISLGKAIIDKLEVEVASLKHEKAELGDTSKQASDEVMGLRKTLETLGHDAEDKERQCAAAVKKLEAELAETTKALEERIAEKDTWLKRHVEEIDSLHSLHAVNLKALESESRDALLEIQKSHDKLIAQSIQSEKEYGEELGALKSEHTETLEQRAKDLEHLITTHATETRDKLDQIERTHQEEIKALIQSTDQKYESLFKEMNTATEQLQQHKDSRDVQAERCEELVKAVESLKSELATSQDELNHATSEIARLTTETEEARKTLQDTTETDHLRYEMFELTRHHAAELARMQDTLDVENEKRAKERKQGAEVRDRLVSETEKLTGDLSAVKLEADKYRMELDVAKTDLQEEVKKNDASRRSIELIEASHQKTTDDLKEARAAIEKVKSEIFQRRDEEESSNINQELEALQIAADAEREQNTKLREQIREASVTAERQAMKLREVEAALKVTSAELVEMRTIRPKGTEFSASPVAKSGLRASRQAILEIEAVGDKTDVVHVEEDEENLGPTISGHVRSHFSLMS